MTYSSNGLFLLSDPIPLCSTASLLLLVGFLSSYLPQYLCHQHSILLYTPHVSTQIPQPSAGQYTIQSNSNLPVDPVPIVTIPWTVPRRQSGFWLVLSIGTVYYSGSLPMPQYILAWLLQYVVDYLQMFTVPTNTLPGCPPL